MVNQPGDVIVPTLVRHFRDARFPACWGLLLPKLENRLPYSARPSWPLYKSLLSFVSTVRADIRDLGPRDLIDVQSFLWVQGSDEYPD